MKNYKLLEPGDIVKRGDQVAVYTDPEEGIRAYTGAVGMFAGEISYPIYRRTDVDLVYFQIKDNEDGTTLTLDPDEAASILKTMVQEERDGNSETYIFSTKTMTEQQFKALPKFKGF